MKNIVDKSSEFVADELLLDLQMVIAASKIIRKGRKMIQKRLESFINNRINQSKFTTYKILASTMGGYACRSRTLAYALGHTLREDHVAGRPHRAASVVRGEKSYGRGFPGPGYFEVCKELGLIDDLSDHVALKRFWASQVTALGLPLPDDYLSKPLGFS